MFCFVFVCAEGRRHFVAPSAVRGKYPWMNAKRGADQKLQDLWNRLVHHTQGNKCFQPGLWPFNVQFFCLWCWKVVDRKLS